MFAYELLSIYVNWLVDVRIKVRLWRRNPQFLCGMLAFNFDVVLCNRGFWPIVYPIHCGLKYVGDLSEYMDGITSLNG